MSMLVSYTQTPMVLDAVGALKVTHYYGRSALDDVYTYLRAFVLRGDLIFSLTAFEQTPPAESRIAVAFRFLPEKDPFFYLTVGPACPVEAFLSDQTAWSPSLSLSRATGLAVPMSRAFIGDMNFACQAVSLQRWGPNSFRAASLPGICTNTPLENLRLARHFPATRHSVSLAEKILANL